MISAACVRKPKAQVGIYYGLRKAIPLTHRSDYFGVRDVVHNDLGHLREVPSIPFLDPHSVDINLLIQVVEQRNSLHHHSVDFVG